MAGETGQGLNSLESTGDSEEYCKACENPAIIPIFPARIAWSDLEGDVNGDFVYPTSLTDMGKSVGDGFCLRSLRAGDVYIYDETNDVWAGFIHAPSNRASAGLYERWEWTSGTEPSEAWTKTDEKLALPFVPDNCESILIAFGSYHWKTMDNVIKNKDSLMTKVQVTAPSAATFSAPLTDIGNYVAEYAGAGAIHDTNVWNALSDVGFQAQSPQRLLSSSSVVNAKGTAIMVGLHDPVGIAREIATGHVNRVSIRSQYLESNAYPLATARAVQVLQNTATTQLATRGLDSRTRDMFTEWTTSVRPEHATFLAEAEAELLNFETVLTGILAAWEKFFLMGEADPAGTPGSLQNALLSFPDTLEEQDEIKGLIDLAQASIASLSASKAGSLKMRSIALARGKWEKVGNPVAAAIKIVGTNLGGGGLIANHRLSTKNAAGNLLADLAMPAALEIEQLQRIDMLTEVNQFSNGIYNKTVRKVMQPISDATAEMMGARPRRSQSTLIQRGQTINRVSVPVGVYKFDGTIHVSGVQAKSALAQGANGFGLFANALNIVTLTSGSDRSRISGGFGAVAADPRLALSLTAVETATQLMDAGYDASTGGRTVRTYFVNGQLNRATLQKLMLGKGLGDDLAKSVIDTNRVAQTRAPALASSRVMSWVGRVATFAGFALGALDLLNAAQAWRRGDTVGMLSNLAMGLGAILLTAGGAAMLAGFTGIGAVVGIVLIVIGVILSFFVDDPTTQWIKGGYWGTAPNYTFWDDTRRSTLTASAAEAGIHDAQRKLSNGGNSSYDIARYFQREMQEFHEMVYWPQDTRDPAEVRGIRTVGWGPFARNTYLMKHRQWTDQFRFRLPNFIDGLSEFDSRFFVIVNAPNAVIPLSEREITDQVRASLRLVNAAEGIFEASYTIHMRNNTDTNVMNDIEWQVLGAYMVKGWKYGPKPDIQLPMNYNDHWFSGAWDDETTIGGQKAIRVG
ncbi:hypothetical protein MWU61_17955 [Loktanella sp. F6476L]|uniref:toxin VasX n=1 Tax=Loktanella sp. F6476L TaxID=2926405 RepID=UPI001FF40B7B|nr:toxin VasX [Loktanella sp. F6476L]MCK0122445.1 hypothetical protein [Loktanella sp. F6476L]